ncbi:hypothetical protein [Methylobacterium sp. C25]|uniref:hypothetical protein n=1 Tax=Methylobacterium sp. C25 TaxID=2721622 RepID=UPI001F421DA8|nr:hypothetical protein [Methylobacterium sp. C25]
MRTATGEDEEDYGPAKPKKDEAASAMGKKGGAARAAAGDRSKGNSEAVGQTLVAMSIFATYK